MQICLFAVNDRALQCADLEAVSVLANGLSSAGNKVDVIAAGFSSERGKPFQARSEASVNFHFVESASSIENLVRFRIATPSAHRSFALAFAVWQEFHRLSLTTQFDIVDAFDAVLSAILPAFSGKTAVVVEASADLEMFKRLKSPFETVPFDQELLSMLQRFSLVLADGVAAPNSTILGRLKEELRLKEDKLVLIDQSAKLQSALYENAIRHHRGKHGAVPYLKPIEELEGDAFTLIKSFDEMIYNFLYQNSWRFRFYHWSVMLRQNPTELFGKISLGCSKAFLKLIGGNARASGH